MHFVRFASSTLLKERRGKDIIYFLIIQRKNKLYIAFVEKKIFFVISHLQTKSVMRKLIIVIFCCLSTLFATANDGVFYASGNQLIPITETDISVQKEVLTLNRVGDHIEVTVYYEFFNPVGEKFYFPYVLTAANRWANHQIDDFLLFINMGDHESFMIRPDFFKTADEWVFTGRGKTSVDSIWVWDEDSRMKACPLFHIQEGGLSFRKANFHPEGELYIAKRSTYYYSEETSDNADLSFLTTYYRPFAQVLSRLCGLYSSAFTIDSSDYNYNYDSVTTPEQRRILKNLPFAYRGYIFKTKALQDYFESTDWYLPNPEYDGNMDAFSAEERKWVEFWK